MSELWVTIADDGPYRSILLRREFPGTPAEVWDAITAPDRLARWLGPATIDGDRVRLPLGRASITGVIEVCDQPRELRLRWIEDELADTMLEVRIDPARAGATTVQLAHRRVGQVEAASYAAGWHDAAARLERELRREQGDPLPDHDALLPAYRAAEARLVAGEVERRDDGWAVSVERMLDAGLADVWGALTEPDRIGRWLWPVVSWPDDPVRQRALSAGDVFVLGDQNLPDGQSRMEVLELVHRRLLVLRWGPMSTQLRFTVTAEPGGTLLRVEQSATPEVLAAGRTRSGPDFAAGWHSLIDGLALYVAGRPNVDGQQLWEAAYQAYAATAD